MVYVPGNDGMLHAFYAGINSGDPQGGQEAWAFIPTTMLPNLYKLADNNYNEPSRVLRRRHSRRWRRLRHAARRGRRFSSRGLNGGGKGYYALDVTDPAAPKGMWEFNHSNTCYNGTPATAGGRLPHRLYLRQAGDHQAGGRHLGRAGDLGLQQRQFAIDRRRWRGLSLRARRLHRPDPLQDRHRRGHAWNAERPGPDQRLRRLRP